MKFKIYLLLLPHHTYVLLTHPGPSHFLQRLHTFWLFQAALTRTVPQSARRRLSQLQRHTQPFSFTKPHKINTFFSKPIVAKPLPPIPSPTI
ncbi:hypothetical protein PanWU01x14_097330 [Parasponia andersonii]|uniref:Uncharacterized protein n=1 Tax=Parasponia andersonii TaxID=3476 RepID=A0A2P5D4D9_PARAD|nr:hypothetical protein PanWU01x14_097330 [Parasponia andersonii]